MSPRALLLRVLLCLSLVLNGSGYAVASTQMQLTHMAAAETAILADAVMPCHTQADRTHSMADMASPAACDDRHPAPSAPDCCQSSQCACDCLQHATATLAYAPAPPAVVVRAPAVAAMSHGHVAPALANPIRPPIA